MRKSQPFNNSPYDELKNPSSKIKDWYSIEFLEIFLKQFSKGALKNPKNFKHQYKNQYKNLELKDRLKLIATLLFDELNAKTYTGKLNFLYDLLLDPWPYEKGMLNYGFYLYPVSQFIELYGDSDVKASLDYIYELTKRFTGEFAIRPMLEKDFNLCIKTIRKWIKDDNFHVRRLCSESLRLRLPWGMSVSKIKENPEKTLWVFEYLKDDSSLYVRRSVANAIGDLIKYEKELALDIIKSWYKSNDKKPELDWVIKHATRYAKKKKDKDFDFLSI